MTLFCVCPVKPPEIQLCRTIMDDKMCIQKRFSYLHFKGEIRRQASRQRAAALREQKENFLKSFPSAC